MWNLLRIELQALANTLKTRDGRQAWIGFVIVIVCIAVGAMAVGANTLMSDEVVAAIRDKPDAPLDGLLGITLCGSTMLAAMLALATMNKEMFANTRTDLLLVAPISRAVIATGVFLRLLFSAFVLQMAAATPLMLGFVFEAGLNGMLLAFFPLSALALTAPCVALLMLAHTVMTRFLSGPVVKFCTQAISAVLVLSITIAFLLGITGGGNQAEALALQVETMESVSFLVEWPVVLLAEAARGTTGAPLFGTLGLLLIPIPVLLVVGAMYGRCREMRFVAHRPVIHRVRAPSTEWPSRAWASIARKDLVELVRNRGGLVALLILTCVILVMTSGFAGGDKISADNPLPAHLQQGFALVTAWQLFAMILGSLLTMSFAGDEGKNLSLLATAPIKPGDLIRGKAFVFTLPFLWSVLVVLIGAPLTSGVSGRAILFFAIAALPLVVIHFGVVAAVSSHPVLFHRKDDVPLAESLSTLGPITVVFAAFMGMLFGTFEVKSIVSKAHWPTGGYSDWDKDVMWWTVAGGLIVGAALVLWIGLRIADRNLRVVLGPRRD